MAEYDLIERNKIFEKITELYRYSKGDMHIAYRELLDYILDMPTADVQPVRHGRWTDNVYKYVKSLDAYFIQAKCSVCGRYSDRIDIYSRFMSNECCSRCGAKMDAEPDEPWQSK